MTRLDGPAWRTGSITLPDEETAARIALVAAGVSGEPAVAVGIAVFGGANRLVTAVHDHNDGAIPLSPAIRSRIRSLSTAQVARIIDQTRLMKLELLTPTQEVWPGQLDALRGRAPLMLWLRGEAGSLLKPSVTLTGATSPSEFGCRMALELATGLAGRRWVLIAGEGRGIDELVHRSALAMGGQTITVSAAGLDRLTARGPRSCQISEVPPGARATVRSKWRAKHLIAALGSKTIIIEGSRSSASYRTAEAAYELGRPLGLADDPRSSQVHARWGALAGQRDVVLVDSIRDADWLS